MPEAPQARGTDSLPPRLLGLAQSQVPTSGAGSAAKFLFDGLGRRFPMVGRESVDLARHQKLPLAALTFHPNRQRWQQRYYFMGNLALNARSRNSARAMRETLGPFDLVVQVFGLFHTRGAPYVLYTDNTAELSERCWPDWSPLEGRALERLYDFERQVYRDALHIFAQGTPAADSIVDFFGAPRERVSVVGGGANFDPLPELGSERREPVVLFVGGDWRRKGGDVLVDAFARVRERIPEARLQIVGTSEAPEGQAGVEVLGRIEQRERLGDVYRRASVFCLPSRFEPYGLVIAEAMAYGLPCVVTRTGALPEVVMEGETGLIVPPDDADALATALTQLLEDPALAERLGRGSRERVERHQNWDAVAERMEPGLVQAAQEARSRASGR